MISEVKESIAAATKAKITKQNNIENQKEKLHTLKLINVKLKNK